jgi:hypothetical protein
MGLSVFCDVLMKGFYSGNGSYPTGIVVCTFMLTNSDSFGPEHVIDPSDDYTRVALDTIALCSMSYRCVSAILVASRVLTKFRLNSFYTVSSPVCILTRVY